MKKLAAKVFVVLAIFFIAVTAVQYWQRDALAGTRPGSFLLNALLLLAATLLLFFFLRLAVLGPLLRHHDGLFRARPPGSAPSPGRRPLFFPEIGAAYAEVEGEISRLHEQIRAGREAKGPWRR